jgi:long-chain acyl-CoA synthetase
MPPISPDPILAAAAKLPELPPPGVPHGVALPGSQKPGYTAVYRHYQNAARELPKTVDPAVRHLS